ncbi:MAG: prepilin-type N-terminal cleavage/methylation domain-containing protein [Clostridia bacterium]|nr:prepilin-type N-terminal cleavage/methylation domain-containing protein [Clostridia bacterium]
MKKALLKLINSRKGVSMTEVIVAMAVLVMVSGAAITVLIASVKADTAFENKYTVLSGCENAAECLRFADGNEILLKEALEKAGFVQTDESEFALEKGNQAVTVLKNDDESYAVVYNGEIIYTYYKKG